MKHCGHNYDNFLDDRDFLEIVNRAVKIYCPEDFDEKDTDRIDEIEKEIADAIDEFVIDEAIDDFGYKYGSTNYRVVASNIIQYIQKNLDELYEHVTTH